VTTALAPIEKTSFYPAFRSGRRECWSARTKDGAWLMERLEISGTPWSLVHAATKTDMGWFGTLRACRAAVASGQAQVALERIQAHERGDHASEREPLCVRC
jgi:hypothetical protein